jgi:tetratricopeptide (TPR) repeat protein
MSSLIHGYEYDIFISYRQKDNKGDRWVSEFVEALKTELESTFKEEISVYFDINQHDGLLETHDVGASLKDKLKCLVFIPIISRTYCDPKSFAWEHEFKAFVDQASYDHFGLKIKLPNGNVASRVLPVRIHDLETEDIKSFEEMTSGVMRTLDFVFKTFSGVNRPLKSREDHPGDNINKTYYQDQVNKVALAIWDIIQGMKTVKTREPEEHGKLPADIPVKTLMNEKINGRFKNFRNRKHVLLPAAIILLSIIIFLVISHSRIFRRDTLEGLKSSGRRITVVVMPFQNLTNDTIWNIWQEGIKDILINSLSNSGEIKIRQSESVYDLIKSQGLVNYASITPELASSFSKRLNADLFINGNIKQAGNVIRLNAQLIDTKTVEVFRSFQVEGASKNEMIFNLIDSLSMMIRNFLIVSELEKEMPFYQFTDASLTNSPEALRYFIYGRNEFIRLKYPAARDWLSRAIAIDSNFVTAIIQLSLAYGNQQLYGQAKTLCMRAYEKRDQVSAQLRTRINWVHAKYFETPLNEIDYLRQMLDFDDQNPITYFNLGTCYNQLFQYDKAIPEYEKALEIHEKWHTKPFWVLNYAYLCKAYFNTGQFRKEEKLCAKAKKDFPNELIQILRYEIVLALTEGDTVEVNKILEQASSYFKNNSVAEAQKMTALATVYSEAGMLDKAERFYRKAFSSEPENPAKINDLAYFLIDKDRNIGEGMELIRKAIASDPDNYNYLETEGWGLYKQGKLKDALKVLQKSWDSRMENAVYDHESFLHLQLARKAVDGHNQDQ